MKASTWYRHRHGSDQPEEAGEKPLRKESPCWDRDTPDQIDTVREIAEKNPWYGYKKIAHLVSQVASGIAARKVYRIMKALNLLHERTRYRAAKLEREVKRLWELLPKGPNQLWQTDVTYIHVPGYGWYYAITVIDYYSRYLLALHFTTSYSAAEASKALRQAVLEAQRIGGPLEHPVFLVTDNGPSFVARRFQQELDRLAQEAGRERLFSHVRIGYRMPTHLGLLERFHRTLKEEEVYWKVYQDPIEADRSLREFRRRYNQDRPHWALELACPIQAYRGEVRVKPPKWSKWATEKGIQERLQEWEAAA
jgi:putative transposase